MLKLIKTTVLDASAASVTIDNIPQEFKTLKLLFSVRTTKTGGGQEYVKLSINGSTANFTSRHLNGNGATAASWNYSGSPDGQIVGWTSFDDYTANTFGSASIVIPNYAGSTNKAISGESVSENNATTSYQALSAALWSSSAAVTSLTLTPYSSTNWKAGSTFYLYGIA